MIVTAIDESYVVRIETERAAHHSVEAEDVTRKLQHGWKFSEIFKNLFHSIFPLVLNQLQTMTLIK